MGARAVQQNMFELERAISEWRREMECRGIEPVETLDELESHLRDAVDEQILSGTQIHQAFNVACTRFGATGCLQTEFEKIRYIKLFHQLKNVLLNLIGIPNYNLATNMNTSFPSPNVEARWATYLKAGTFLAPSLVLWIFSCVFMMPKLKQICGNAGFALPTVLQATLFATSHGALIAGGLIVSFVLLEWRAMGWPKYRRAVIGSGVFVINALVLILITTMVFFALVAAPAFAHATH